MTRVFVPQISQKFDMGDAKRYGTIVPLTEERIDPLNPPSVVSLFISQLENLDFDPEKDYVCLTGSQLVTAMFLAVLSARYEELKLLIFDSRNSSYCVRLFNADPFSEE